MEQVRFFFKKVADVSYETGHQKGQTLKYGMYLALAAVQNAMHENWDIYIFT